MLHHVLRVKKTSLSRERQNNIFSARNDDDDDVSCQLALIVFMSVFLVLFVFLFRCVRFNTTLL